MKALDPGSNDRDQQVFQWGMGMDWGQLYQKPVCSSVWHY